MKSRLLFFSLLLPITCSFSLDSLSVTQSKTTIPFSRYQEIVDSFYTIIEKQNPLLKVAAVQIDLAKKNILKAKSFEPPQLGIELNNSPLMKFPAKPMDVTLSIEQMFMFPGKRSAMAFAESQRVTMSQFEQNVQQQSLKQNVRNVFADLYFAWRKKEIIQENILLVFSFGKIATKQYEVGMGMQADLFRAKIELAGLRRDSIQTEQTITSMTAMLNAFMNQPVNQPITAIDWVDVPVVNQTLTQLCSLAVKNRPDLRAMEANITMREAEAKAIKRSYYPDFMLKGMYMNSVESEDDNLSVMFGMTVPITPWSDNKFTAGYSIKQYEAVIAKHEYDNMENMVFSQIQDALATIDSYRGQLDIALKHTLPYATQALEATMTAYSNGKTEFLMLIDAQRMLLMAHMDHHMAIMGMMQGITQIEQAVGVGIGDMQLSKNSKEK